jgi:hypothetical protein
MHVMLDLETMGVTPGCAIVSIGAVAFDPTVRQVGPELNQTFHVKVDLLSCVLAGLRVEPATVYFWRQKASPEARAALADGDRVPIHDALQQFTEWFISVQGEQIWANGPVSDVAWLEAAYRAANMQVSIPFDHRAPRCYRTIVELAGLERNQRAQPVIEHDALADAIAQAIDVCTCYVNLKARNIDELA